MGRGHSKHQRRAESRDGEIVTVDQIREELASISREQSLLEDEFAKLSGSLSLVSIRYQDLLDRADRLKKVLMRKQDNE